MPALLQSRPRGAVILLQAEWFDAVGLTGGRKGESLADLLKRDERAIRNSLAASADLAFVERVRTRDQAAKAAARCADPALDFLLVAFITWAEDYLLLPFLRRLPPNLPVGYWCYAHHPTGPGRDAVPELLRNSGMVGTFEGAGVVRGYRRDWETFIGTPDAPAFRDAFGAWARAARVRAGLERLTIGLLPYRNDQMMVTYVDEFRLQRDLGPAVRFLSVRELGEHAKKVPEAEARAWVKTLTRRHPRREVSDAALLSAARASLGLERLVAKEKLEVLALNDICPELHAVLGQRPCLYGDELIERETVIGLEGDLGCTAAMWMLQALGAGPVMFGEPYNWNARTNALVAGHAGPQNPAMAKGARRVTLTPDYEYRAVDPTEGAWMEFCAGPGRVTLLNLVCAPDGFRMIVTGGGSLGGATKLAGYPHAHIKLDDPIEPFLRNVVASGCSHHWAVGFGDVKEPVERLGKMLGLHVLDA